MYSNRRYGMGDVIWIGAKWGREYHKDVGVNDD